jgi:hypothetical protein
MLFMIHISLEEYLNNNYLVDLYIYKCIHYILDVKVNSAISAVRLTRASIPPDVSI